ncbi:MAG: hypothetical protein ABSA45_07395 [Verrucomicrobiota bacterium]
MFYAQPDNPKQQKGRNDRYLSQPVKFAVKAWQFMRIECPKPVLPAKWKSSKEQNYVSQTTEPKRSVE